jgi:hypothetical protein
VTGAAPERDRISAGSLLKRSTLLLLHHPVNLLLTIASLAAASLVALPLAGHCFRSAASACVSPAVYDWLGLGSMAVQHEVATAGGRLACKIVLTVALWCLFTRAESGRPSVSGRRIMRFVARMIVYWIVFETPYWILVRMDDLVAAVFGRGFASVGMTGVAIALYSYLHAKLVLYVISGVYDEKPLSFRESWNATRDQTGAFFRAFLTLQLLSLFVVFGFWYLGGRVSGVPLLSSWIADWSGVEESVARNAITTEFGNVLGSSFKTLGAGAMAVIAYRVVIARNFRSPTVSEGR